MKFINISYLPLLVGIIGFITAASMGEIYAVGSLSLVVPLILSSIVYTLFLKDINFKKQTLFNTNLYIGPIISLFLFSISQLILYNSVNRSLSYFVVMSAIFSNIFIQITNQKRYTKSIVILILLQICLLFLNLIWSKNLYYPLYFEYFDVFVHLEYINNIVMNGYIDSSMSFYQYFPVQHIFIVISSIISNISTQRSLFIFFGIAYLVVFIMSYLVIKSLFKDEEFALISTLIFAISPHNLFHAAYATPRAFSFIFLMTMYYLLCKTAQTKTVLLYLFFMLIATITHSASNLQFFIILFVYYIAINYMSAKNIIVRTAKPKLNFLVLYIAITSSYWVYIAATLFKKIVANVFYKTFVIVEQEGMNIQSATASTNITSFLIDNIYSSIYLFIFTICVLVYIKELHEETPRWNRYKPITPFILSSLIFSLIYFPNPLTMSQISSETLKAWRWGLYVEFFIVVCVSFGLLVLIRTITNSNKISLKTPLVILITISVCFFAISNSYSASDNLSFGNSKVKYKPYLDYVDLKVFDNIKEISNNQTILSDAPVTYYFHLNEYENISVISVKDDKINIKNDSLFILRKDEFEKGVLPVNGLYISDSNTIIEYSGSSKILDAGKIIVMKK
jgi:hypothetical protein